MYPLSPQFAFDPAQKIVYVRLPVSMTGPPWYERLVVRLGRAACA